MLPAMSLFGVTLSACHFVGPLAMEPVAEQTGNPHQENEDGPRQAWSSGPSFRSKTKTPSNDERIATT